MFYFISYLVWVAVTSQMGAYPNVSIKFLSNVDLANFTSCSSVNMPLFLKVEFPYVTRLARNPAEPAWGPPRL